MSVMADTNHAAAVATAAAQHKTSSPENPSIPMPSASSPKVSSEPPGELSLTAVLQDKEGAGGVFMAYARQDLSEENLEFHFEVADFLATWDRKGGDDEGRKDLADTVIRTYLKAGAPKQICIGDHKVKRMLEEVENGQGYARGMFAEAARIAERTLAEDIFPRFQTSDAGVTLAKTRPELCETPNK